MTAVADDLIAFIKARLAEDEQVAKACAGAPWVQDCAPMVHVDPKAIRDAKWIYGKMGYVGTVEHDYDRAHMVRHDPARVLRGVEAKRRLLDTWQGITQTERPDWMDNETWRLSTAGTIILISHMTAIMALEWAYHPDYRQEWTP